MPLNSCSRLDLVNTFIYKLSFHGSAIAEFGTLTYKVAAPCEAKSLTLSILFPSNFSRPGKIEKAPILPRSLTFPGDLLLLVSLLNLRSTDQGMGRHRVEAILTSI